MGEEWKYGGLRGWVDRVNGWVRGSVGGWECAWEYHRLGGFGSLPYLGKSSVRNEDHHPHKFPKTQQRFHFLRMSNRNHTTTTATAAATGVGVGGGSAGSDGSGGVEGFVSTVSDHTHELFESNRVDNG